MFFFFFYQHTEIFVSNCNRPLLFFFFFFFLDERDTADYPRAPILAGTTSFFFFLSVIDGMLFTSLAIAGDQDLSKINHVSISYTCNNI